MAASLHSYQACSGQGFAGRHRHTVGRLVPAVNQDCQLRWQGQTGCQGQLVARPQLSLQLCRVTNTTEEIYRAMGEEPPNAEVEDLRIFEYEVPNPELGPLAARVGKFLLDEMANDTGVDLEETAYWFHTPPSGWSSDVVNMPPAEEAPVTLPEPYHEDASSTGRIKLEDLREGEVITGKITDCWLYHGIQVDIGAEFDGLVYIHQDGWMEPGVRETLLPEDEVQVRVWQLRQPGLYRWPVQLELVSPAHITAVIPRPEAYSAPIDHGWCIERGWGFAEICEATGRTFEPSRYHIPGDHAVDMEAMEAAYGFDDPEGNVYIEDPMTEYITGIEGQTLINESIATLAY